MSSGLYSALSAGIAKMQELQVESNNLTNTNTYGYKKDHLDFQALYKKATQDQLGKGVNFITVKRDYVDFSQGESAYTGKPLDLSIEGKGFFKLKDPKGGYHYTRLGSFLRDADGNLVNASGWKVMDDRDRPITIPDPKGIKIDQDGTIHDNGDPVGKIPLYSFKSTSVLQKEGAGIFNVQASGATDFVLQNPRMMQGRLEESNVKPLQEMALMMDGLRAFQAYQKVIKTYDSMAAQQNQLGAVS
jgi:flagellar basal body rod protein FlgG